MPKAGPAFATGRRAQAIAAGANVVLVRGVKHTLTHMSVITDPKTGERVWKSNRGMEV